MESFQRDKLAVNIIKTHEMAPMERIPNCHFGSTLFLGGGSDLPAYYRRHGGAVLSTTIDQSVYVTVSRKCENAVRVGYSRTE
jgi:hypothetical protein